MNRVDGRLRISASDLSDFLACRHLTRQSQRVALGDLGKPGHGNDAGFDSLVERGKRHEAEVLARWEAEGQEFLKLEPFGANRDDAHELTLKAIAEGVPGIYQAALMNETELGYPDFLIRADLLPGADDKAEGYEVIDAKLARSAKARAVLQTTFYSRLLTDVQGHAPNRLYLALGGRDDLETFRVADFSAYERQVSRMLGEFLTDAKRTDPYPDPVEHCAICRWRFTCTKKRHVDDDLSLVANISARHRKILKEHGIETLTAFAELPAPPHYDDLAEDAFTTPYEQARIQLKGRQTGKPEWAFKEPEREPETQVLVPNRGLLALPEPTTGDLFFDIEGARFYSEDNKTFGLQYLFGIVDTADIDPKTKEPRYHQIWSFNRTEEKGGFEELIDFFTQRIEANPTLHIYHYNHYETTAIDALSAIHDTMQEAVGELMGRLGTKEDETDDLFRLGVFVDLYRVVKQSIIASVESYSIKRLEDLVGYTRRVELADVNERMVIFEANLEDGSATEDPETKEVIRGYNEDDCRATQYLRDWLEARRPDLEAKLKTGPLPRPTAPEVPADHENEEITALYEQLTQGVPEDPAERSDEEGARALTADLLEWHRREDKPAWWNVFYLCGLSDEEMFRFESVLFGLEVMEEIKTHRKNRDVLFTYPEQEHPFDGGGFGFNPHTDEDFPPKYALQGIDHENNRVVLRIPIEGPPPRALIPDPIVQAPAQKARLFELGQQVVALGTAAWPHSAAFDLLLRRPPNLSPKQPLRKTEEDEAHSAARIALALKGSCLPIQGPPGSGKTYAGALIILDLVDAGKKVGVTGPSHSVIDNLLQEVVTVAKREKRAMPKLGQVIKENRERIYAAASARGKAYENNPPALEALEAGDIDVLGGTAWLWASEKAVDSVGVMIVDEAGQVSLANTLAVAAACNSLVLLGDPMQLAQVSHASHPGGAGSSALEHVLGEHLTMPEDLGLFIEHTRRMHPDITAFTSEVFYDGKLESLEGLENQCIVGKGELAGTGLRAVAVKHEGNTNASVEEAEVVAQIVGEVLGKSWEDADGKRKKLTAKDVLIVTPFNAQITEISLALEEAGITGVLVGTVDKFQGKQAPIAIYSLASSSAESAPHGMEFLYELNRLNVATSRARCISIVVANPELARVFCKTPRQMQLANALCRARETGRT